MNRKGSADRFISRGTSHDRNMGTGKAFSGTIGPEGADYSDNGKWGVKSGYGRQAPVQQGPRCNYGDSDFWHL
jgi:hypothetical protein